ncbi:MAG: PhoU domain-containing protein [Candidatus Hodarchaeota archaeon]
MQQFILAAYAYARGKIHMEPLESRKLQKTSGSPGTFLISLPSGWVRANDLEKGDELAIKWSEDRNYLLIYPKQGNRSKQMEIIIRESDETRTQRDILKNYLEGYQVLIVTRDPNKSSLCYPDVIKGLSRRLFGLEVVAEEQSKIELHYTADPHLDPHLFLEMSYSNAIKMFDDVIKAYLDFDTNLAMNVIDRDNDVNRLYFLIVRMLKLMVQDITGQHNVPPVECLDFRMVASYAENIGDRAVEIARRVEKINNPLLTSSKELRQEIFRYTAEICEDLRQVVKAFINHQVEKAEKMKRKAQKELTSEIPLLRGQFNHESEESDKLTYLLPAFQRLLEIIADIADLVIGEE